MSDVFRWEDIKTFVWEELNGKNCDIYVSKSVDGLVVSAVDTETEKVYIIHQEVVPED